MWLDECNKYKSCTIAWRSCIHLSVHRVHLSIGLPPPVRGAAESLSPAVGQRCRRARCVPAPPRGSRYTWRRLTMRSMSAARVRCTSALSRWISARSRSFCAVSSRTRRSPSASRGAPGPPRRFLRAPRASSSSSSPSAGPGRVASLPPGAALGGSAGAAPSGPSSSSSSSARARSSPQPPGPGSACGESGNRRCDGGEGAPLAPGALPAPRSPAQPPRWGRFRGAPPPAPPAGPGTTPPAPSRGGRPAPTALRPPSSPRARRGLREGGKNGRE